MIMLFEKLLNLGTNKASNQYSLIRIPVINRLSIASILILLIFGVFELVMQFNQWILIALASFVILHISVLIFNNLGYFLISKLALFGLGAIGVAIISFVFGLAPNFQYYFLIFIGIPFLFFEKKYWKYVFIYAIGTLMIWIALKIYLNETTPIVSITHFEAKALQVFNLILTGVTFALVTLQFEIENLHFIKQLHKKQSQENILANISQMFFQTDKFNEKLQYALKSIGDETQCSRIRLHNHNYEVNTTSMIHEWCNLGVKPKFEDLQNIQYTTDSDLRAQLIANKSLVLNDVQHMVNKNAIKAFHMEDIKSLIIFPIYLNNNYNGFIMFEDHHKNRIWSEHETEFMRASSAIIANILAKVHYEKEVAEDQIKLNILFEESLDPIMIIDPETTNLIDVNETTCKTYGYTKEEMLQLSVIADIETSKDRTQKNRDKVITEGTNRFKATHKTKNGSIIDVIVNLKTITLKNKKLIYAIYHNITDEIKAKEIAERNEKKLNEAQQLAKIGTWEYDYVKDVSFWTEEQFNILGIKHTDKKINFSIFMNFVHPDDKSRVRIAQLNHFKTQKPVDIVHRIISDDQQIKYVREKLKTIFDSNGKPIRTIGSMADITDQIKIENELRVANETKTKMFSVIAHDLRSPVSQIMQLNNLLEENDLDESLIKSLKDEQKKLTENTFTLLENLLKWAQVNSNGIKYSPEILNLNELVEECISNAESLIKGKEINISAFMCKNCLAYADREMVKLIFRNLSSNAIKFTPKGGNISLKIGIHENEIQATVTDSGIGISKENIAKILSDGEFYSTYGTNDEKGSGLGLQLVRSFIKLNKGTFKIESEEGKGSTFSFTLPKFIN